MSYKELIVCVMIQQGSPSPPLPVCTRVLSPLFLESPGWVGLGECRMPGLLGSQRQRAKADSYQSTGIHLLGPPSFSYAIDQASF